MVKHGFIAGVMFSIALVASTDPVKVSWEDLSGYNYETRAMSPLVQNVHQKRVQVEGFIVPTDLEGDIDTVHAFFLVPNPLACIHVPPPPPNQMIYVTMNKPIPIDMDERGVRITGLLSVGQPEDQSFYVGFELDGDSAVSAEIEWEDPFEALGIPL